MVVFVKFEAGGTTFDDAQSVQVSSSIGTNNVSSSFKATFKNLDGKHNTDFSVGQEVIITAEKDVDPPTTKLLTGLIEDIKFKGQGQNEIVEISGRDFMSRLIDSMVEPEVFNNTEVSVIVKDLIDKYVTGVTVGGVVAPGGGFGAHGIGGTQEYDATTRTIDNISFVGVSVFDAIKKLAELSDSYFFIDQDKNLFFKDRGSIISGLTLDSTNIVKANFKTSRSELFNRVFVYGERIFTGIQDEFLGDGAGSEFTLSYKPHNTEVTVNGSVVRQGGLFQGTIGDPVSGTEYQVDFDNQKVIFLSGTNVGDNVPPNNGSIIIAYDRSTPIIKFAEDRASADQFGPRTKWIVDRNIKTPSHATDTALNVLSENKDPRTQGTIDLQGLTTLTAGNTIIVNIPNQNINSEVFDILEVRYNFDTRNNLSDRVMSVRVNKRIRDMTDTMKEIINNIRELQARDMLTSDVITRLEVGAGSYSFRVKEFEIRTRTLGNSFILGKGPHGVTGPTFGGILGSVVASGINFLGDSRSAFTVQQSGGEV